MSLLIRPPIMRLARRLLGLRFRRVRAAYNSYRENTLGMDPLWVDNIGRLRKYQNQHKGDRCFILGNGPSLAKTDLCMLRNEVTFGLNRVYLLFDEIGFTTTYYVAVNNLVIKQCAEEIVRLTCPKFISWEARKLLDFTPDMMFLRSQSGPKFYTDITEGVWEGATVTYVAMQVAYYMGFEKVFLIGLDHSFLTKGKPHTVVISQGDDYDHFDPKYFSTGFRWNLPDLETSELAYRVAKYQFEGAGREIVDATIEGKLEVFRKVDYYQLFD